MPLTGIPASLAADPGLAELLASPHADADLSCVDGARVPLAAALMSALLLPSVAGAQENPPYQASLLRLTEILGALHYLRPLCGAAEDGVWRQQMEALLTAEAPPASRKAEMVTQFNRGYAGFATTYRSCTPSAIAAIDRYVAEGARLTQELITRYGR